MCKTFAQAPVCQMVQSNTIPTTALLDDNSQRIANFCERGLQRLQSHYLLV
jgi:hypothetical protein